MTPKTSPFGTWGNVGKAVLLANTTFFKNKEEEEEIEELDFYHD